MPAYDRLARGPRLQRGRARHLRPPRDLVAALAHLPSHLTAFGETLPAGEVLITRSIVPALSLGPGQCLEYRLEPLGDLSTSWHEPG